MTQLDIQAVQNITARKRKESKRKALVEVAGYIAVFLVISATSLMFLFY